MGGLAPVGRRRQALIRKNGKNEWILKDSILNHVDDEGVDDVRLEKKENCEFIVTPPKDPSANEDDYILIGRGWVDR